MKRYKVKVNGKVYEVDVEAVDELAGKIETPKAEKKETKEVKAAAGDNTIIAPIAGKVLDIKVKEGDKVAKGQTVAVIEAMKLENEITSSFDGKVKAILVAKGDDVRNKDALIILE